MEHYYSIKDNTNLLTHNQWTAGEYLNNWNEFVSWGTSIRSISNEQPYIGNKSLKLVSSDSTITIIDIVEELSQENIGDTIVFSAYLIGNNANLKVMYHDGDNYIKTVTTDINSMSFQKYIISSEVPEDAVNVRLRINSNGETTIYADNFSMTIQ